MRQGAPCGIAAADDDLAADLDHVVAMAQRVERARGGVGAVALGDAGQVGPEPCAVLDQRAGGGVDRQRRQPIDGARVGDAPRSGGTARASRAIDGPEAPGVDRRRDRDVERAARGRGDLLRDGEHGQRFGRHRERRAGVVRIEAREFRRRPVRRHRDLDALERGGDGGARGVLLRRATARARRSSACTASPSPGPGATAPARRKRRRGGRRRRRAATRRPSPAARCGGGGRAGCPS